MGRHKEWTEKRLNLIREFISSGKSIEFIAGHFGIGIGALRNLMHQEKIYLKKKQSGQSNTLLQKKRKQQEDLSTRIRILKGEEIRTTKATCYFTDEQIKPWLEGAEGCNRFCQEVLNVKLQDYQLDIIDKMLNHKRFVGVLGRQAGKDWLISCFVIWRCITCSNQKILLVSAGQRQSDLLYNRILGFIGYSSELFDSVDKSNMEKCRLKNNSEIWSLPATGFIRGFTEVTHIFLNEAHEIPDYTFSAVEPMLAITDGYLYLFSTPRGCVGRLWDVFNNPFFAKVQLPSTKNKYIPKEWFKRQKETMDALEYDMEINAQFQQSVDTFFKLDTINDVSYEYSLRAEPEADKDYYCGIDWGRTHDYSVITILSKMKGEYQAEEQAQYKIENIIEMSKVPFPEQVRRIIDLHSKFNFIKIIPEWAGLGIPPCDELKEKLGSDIIQVFIPTIDAKAEAYSKLRKIMENKQITIPKSHTALQFELRTFQYQLLPSGKMKLFHLAKSSDDRIDSLCFSVFGAVEDKDYEEYEPMLEGFGGVI